MFHWLIFAEFSCLLSISCTMSEQRYREPQTRCIDAFHLEFTLFSYIASQRLINLFLNMEKHKECSFTECLLTGSEAWLKQWGLLHFGLVREQKSVFCRTLLLQTLTLWLSILSMSDCFFFQILPHITLPHLLNLILNIKC